MNKVFKPELVLDEELDGIVGGEELYAAASRKIPDIFVDGIPNGPNEGEIPPLGGGKRGGGGGTRLLTC